MNAETTIAEMDHVARWFDQGDAGRLEVLRDVSLRVEPGESLAVVGPSGSGKSTLLNILAGLDRPSSGRVILDGRELSGLDDPAMSRLRCARIGIVFQLHHLLPQCSVLENVIVPTLAPGAFEGESAGERARELLERVGLSDRLNHRPGQLSGGERQRVAVVRALINRPALLLADEPTGSLDSRASDALADLLVELNREQGVALLTVTHSMQLARRMGRLLELDNGTLRPTREEP
ncbi:MAG: ABC transporter ATP-binding protein [Phycisphaerae bacterium]